MLCTSERHLGQQLQYRENGESDGRGVESYTGDWGFYSKCSGKPPQDVCAGEFCD